ncbi:MAG TPA: nucleobase:cation symporter-2 family protein [Pseudonocardia sp.]|nr:nucleobase:cation symporter-2 family protein [Pseudonocardia sp.]
MAWKLKRKAAPGGEVHPVDEVMPVGQLLLYGLQHVMSMYAGVIAVPLIIGTAMGLPFAELAYLLTAALLVSGLATLLQTLGVWKLGARLPLVQGTSFVAVASMLAIGKTAGGGAGALTVIFGAVLVAGVIGFLLTPLFNRLLHYFPPVVTGSIITVIGLSLLPVAVNWSAGGVGSEHFGSPGNIGLAFLTLLIILFIYRFLPGFFSRIAILAGLALGTIVAIPLGMTNFSRVGEAAWVAVSTPFHFGFPRFEFAAILSMTIVMIVIMTEATADILAIGEIVDKPADGRTVVAGLRADCLSSAVSGGLLNGFQLSAFAQNVGLVAITGIKSRFVVAAGGVILVLLGLLPKLGAIVASIPTPVLGGAGLALFGTVAASGIRALSRVDYEGNANLVIVALALGMGVLPIAVPTFYEEFPAWFGTIFESGICAAAVTAVLLNLLFNAGAHQRDDGEGPIFSEAPPPGITPDHDVPGGVGHQRPESVRRERRRADEH